MKLGIMQPYFLPYIGYFQLIAAVDEFVIYDNIKYTKKGWINRNRMLLNGGDSTFSLPLKSASDTLDVVEREIAPDFRPDKLMNQFRGAYGRAPHYRDCAPLLEEVLFFEERNLFRFILHSLQVVCRHLQITTPIRVSSGIPIDHGLKGQEKVLALCHAQQATTYINAIGGTELYDRQTFSAQGIELKFIEAMPFDYVQFGNKFVPWLSIADVLMFNPVNKVRETIRGNYRLH